MLLIRLKFKDTLLSSKFFFIIVLSCSFFSGLKLELILLAHRDIKTAQKTLWMNWPLLTLLSFSTSFSGLAIFSRYYECDPAKSCQIASSDQVLIYLFCFVLVVKFTVVLLSKIEFQFFSAS